jgi:hypothetical protein
MHAGRAAIRTSAKHSWTWRRGLPIFRQWFAHPKERSCPPPVLPCFAFWTVGAPAADAAEQKAAADAAEQKAAADAAEHKAAADAAKQIKASPGKERNCDSSCSALHFRWLGLAYG